MNNKEIYRACASILLLRPAKTGEGYELLLLKKPRKRDAWQLPQGGVEAGETTEQAAVRELQEEADVHAQVLGKSQHVYQYEFPASYRRFRPDHVKGQRVEFVYAFSEEDISVHVDNKEIENYVWVLPEELPKYLHRKPYRQLVHAIIEEATAALRK